MRHGRLMVRARVRTPLSSSSTRATPQPKQSSSVGSAPYARSVQTTLVEQAPQGYGAVSCSRNDTPILSSCYRSRRSRMQGHANRSLTRLCHGRQESCLWHLPSSVPASSGSPRYACGRARYVVVSKSAGAPEGLTILQVARLRASLSGRNIGRRLALVNSGGML